MRFNPVDIRINLILEVFPMKVPGLFKDGQMTGLDMSIGHSNQIPPVLLGLGDSADRLSLFALVYGYRQEPFGIRARMSSDQGHTWGPELVLRDDGGCWDLGYPRTVQRKDGKLVSIYYFNDDKDQERYIGATIWEP